MQAISPLINPGKQTTISKDNHDFNYQPTEFLVDLLLACVWIAL